MRVLLPLKKSLENNNSSSGVGNHDNDNNNNDNNANQNTAAFLAVGTEDELEDSDREFSEGNDEEEGELPERVHANTPVEEVTSTTSASIWNGSEGTFSDVSIAASLPTAVAASAVSLPRTRDSSTARTAVSTLESPDEALALSLGPETSHRKKRPRLDSHSSLNSFLPDSKLPPHESRRMTGGRALRSNRRRRDDDDDDDEEEDLIMVNYHHNNYRPQHPADNYTSRPAFVPGSHHPPLPLVSHHPLRAAAEPILENEPPPLFTNHASSSTRAHLADASSAREALESRAATSSEEPAADGNLVQEEEDDQYRRFGSALKKRGLEIVQQEGDGNCLFRAVSLQVYGDANMHGEVRERCLDFMARDEAHFAQFVTGEPFAHYIARKRQLGEHGNNPEIQALSELFNRPVEVFVPEHGAIPINIFHAEYKTADAPIRLSYHDGNHYNAVIDPLVPTAGLGLGMPGLQPGLADKLQVAKAVVESDQMADQMELERALKESENDELQRALKESSYSMDHLYKSKAMALSDLDATNFELEQTVLESSLESYRGQEHGRKQHASPKPPGRRRRPSPPLPAFAESSSNVAAIPPPAAESIPLVASAASASMGSERAFIAALSPTHLGSVDEYPQTVQEMVMNGFDLCKVVHAYELVGDNFDDLLALLMGSS